MQKRPLLIVILAAGKGTRMKSRRPKVLHEIAGRSLIGHVMAAAKAAGAERLAVVIGPGMDDVRAEVGRNLEGSDVFVQTSQLGTADALLAARPALERHQGDVIVLFGDTPLITAQTIMRTADALAGGASVAVVGFEAGDPTGYGRILRDATGCVAAIREEKEASEGERQIRLCNSGVMGFRSEHLLGILTAIGNANAKGEYYLTDAVEIAHGRGQRTVTVMGSEGEMMGINDRAQLAAADAIFQATKRAAVMAGGATLVAPETVTFSHDTIVGEDVLIEPYVVIGPGVTIESNVTIRAFTHVVGTDRKSQSGARISSGSEVGPFARLRPGTNLGANVHIGNFVEVKNAVLEDGAKANHLSYLGDAHIGKGANIGAGTITCNYDGFNKHRTEIGADAFIGSNTALVAPVSIGEGAIVGAGSVITKDVAGGALAMTRADQKEWTGWAARFKRMMQRPKAKTA